MNKKMYFVLCCVCLIGFVGLAGMVYGQQQQETNQSAQEEAVSVEAGPQYESRDACLAQLDASQVDFLNPFFLEKTKINKSELLPYFSCRAALENNSTVCDKLQDQSAQKCKQYFAERQGFLGQLLFLRSAKQPLTRQSITMCMQSTGLSQQGCRQFLEAFIAGDTDGCRASGLGNRKSWCEALITLDENKASNRDVRDQVYYLKAMQDLSVAQCRKLSRQDWQKECEAYVTGNEKVCEQCEGFQKLKELYCDYQMSLNKK